MEDKWRQVNFVKLCNSGNITTFPESLKLRANINLITRFTILTVITCCDSEFSCFLGTEVTNFFHWLPLWNVALWDSSRTLTNHVPTVFGGKAWILGALDRIFAAAVYDDVDVGKYSDVEYMY